MLNECLEEQTKCPDYNLLGIEHGQTNKCAWTIDTHINRRHMPEWQRKSNDEVEIEITAQDNSGIPQIRERVELGTDFIDQHAKTWENSDVFHKHDNITINLEFIVFYDL